MSGDKIKYTSNKFYLFKAIFDWLIDNDATPYLHVDASIAGVDVPQQHIKDNQIVLNIRPEAIEDWYIDKQAISFKARFSGRRCSIYVPMNAILALYSKENGLGMAFSLEESPDPEPDDNAQISPFQQKSAPSAPPNKPSGKKGFHLKVIK